MAPRRKLYTVTLRSDAGEEHSRKILALDEKEAGERAIVRARLAKSRKRVKLTFEDFSVVACDPVNSSAG